MNTCCKASKLVILVAKSFCTLNHAHDVPIFTRRHDPDNEFANNIAFETTDTILPQRRWRASVHAARLRQSGNSRRAGSTRPSETHSDPGRRVTRCVGIVPH